MRPRVPRAALGALGLALVLAGGPVRPAGAESWGGIVPGESTARDLEARHGRPTRQRPVVEEGRTVSEWTYLGERAPAGLERMVVSFGFLRPGGFAPEVVRALAIYPKPRVFDLGAIATGWGTPDAVGTDERTGQAAFRYDRKGLLILLDPTGGWAEMMLFAPTPPDGRP